MDDSILARIRRSGYAGRALKEAQEYDDSMASYASENHPWGQNYHNTADAEAESSTQDHVQRQRGSTGGAGAE